MLVSGTKIWMVAAGYLQTLHLEDQLQAVATVTKVLVRMILKVSRSSAGGYVGWQVAVPEAEWDVIFCNFPPSVAKNQLARLFRAAAVFGFWGFLAEFPGPGAQKAFSLRLRSPTTLVGEPGSFEGRNLFLGIG